MSNHGVDNETLVRLDGVRKSFRRGRVQVPVLKDLDLEVAKGEFVAIMGPSGSGKSTLLNLIAGLDRPDTGSVSVGGVRVDKLSFRKLAGWRARNVSYVFQMYNLVPGLSAERNVELPLLLTRLPRKARKDHVAAALSVVGLEHRRKHGPGELSGGEQQRVGIARAIVTDSPLLVCDEPTGDLDRQSGDDVLELLVALRGSHGKTILMVTHDPRAAERTDRILQLGEGRLVTEAVEMAS